MTAPAPDVRLIPESVVAGKRLGRHINHDPRSLNFEVQKSGTVVSKLWARRTPILDQGNVGSCTGNAATGALGSDPNYGPLAGKLKAGLRLDEAEALRIYSAAETIDGDGPYPPNDNGSSGLSVAKAAKNAGLISGYTHAFSVAGMNAALQHGPVLVGMNWYDSFDAPDPHSGKVGISPNAVVRGGHEVLIRAVDVSRRLYGGDNSWSRLWGIDGRFEFSWDTMDRLFAEGGDCVLFAPLTAPGSTPHGHGMSLWNRVKSFF